jgi:hypothetical protein
MTDIRHYWKGELVNPRDFKTRVTIDWLNRKSQPSIDVETLRFFGDTGARMRERFLNGLNGGVGTFEGDPYTIEIGDSTTKVFEGYLDFSVTPKFIGCSEIEVTVKKKQGIDWLNDVADGFSYRYLESIGVIKQSDFYSVPYVINYIPDGVQLLLLAISAFSLTKEAIEQVKNLADRIADLSDAATPVVGVSAGFGGGAVTAYDIGNIIMAALKLIAQIAYLAAIVYAIVKLTEQIIEQLMPPTRYHLSTPLKVLFTRACEHLNLKLSSTLLDSLDKNVKWCIMPRKNHRGGERPPNADTSWRETGVPEVNSNFDTFAKVISTCKAWFNADYKIVDGTFYFERRDMFRTNGSWVVPNTFTNQETSQDENTFNLDEFNANYVISYQEDLQDQNTLDNVGGLVFQSQISANVVGDATLTSLKGSQEINIPLALPVRKDALTVIEEIVKGFATAVETITGQLQNPASLVGKINNRIGAMHLSSHFTSVSKVIAMQGSQLAKQQRTILSAQRLWTNYHFINSFAPINGVHNQYYRYAEQPIAFCMDDFNQVEVNNLIETSEGEKAEIERIVWDTWNNKAVIDYRVNRLYNNNFKINYL